MTKQDKRIELFKSLGMYECSTFIYCYDFMDFIIEINYQSDDYSGEFFRVMKSGEQDLMFGFICGTAVNFKNFFNLTKNKITDWKKEKLK
jgi:hypothetical protein